MLIIAPLVFLGGSFYSISMLPPLWQKITLFNPVVYLISGFRWSFFGTADVAVAISLAAIAGFMLVCMGIVWWIFKTGYRLKSLNFKSEKVKILITGAAAVYGHALCAPFAGTWLSGHRHRQSE